MEFREFLTGASDESRISGQLVMKDEGNYYWEVKTIEKYVDIWSRYLYVTDKGGLGWHVDDYVMVVCISWADWFLNYPEGKMLDFYLAFIDEQRYPMNRPDPVKYFEELRKTYKTGLQYFCTFDDMSDKAGIVGMLTESISRQCKVKFTLSESVNFVDPLFKKLMDELSTIKDYRKSMTLH